VEIEPRWETNPATTPREELGMVSPELLWLRRSGWSFGDIAAPRPDRGGAGEGGLGQRPAAGVEGAWGAVAGALP